LLRHEVERHLTGKETEPTEIIYFKLYKSQVPVIEQAIETAAMMLGSDKSRGYCLEMICADFLAGANLDQDDPEILLKSVSRLYKFLPGEPIPERPTNRDCMMLPLPKRAANSAGSRRLPRTVPAGAATGRLALPSVWKQGQR
jgi:hypothetical protein